MAVTHHHLLVGATAAVGLAMVALGALSHFVGWGITSVAAVTFVIAALVGNVLPWVGISSSRLTTHPPKSDVEIFADAPEVERDQVRRQVAAGHELMVALGVASAGVMILCTPQLVASGRPGALLTFVGFVATLLRTRHSRTRTTVLIAMIAGVTGVAVAAVAAAQTHPDWRPAAGPGARRSPPPSSWRWRSSSPAPASSSVGSPTPSKASPSSPSSPSRPSPSGSSEAAAMATKKDLVEAQSFSKRRLTTAFVSGSPGGREVEPHRPMKAVIGGLALTVVLVLGSLAFGWLKGSLPQNWGDNKLVIAKTSGARYVSIKETLHPVLNTTSARLLIPANSFEVITVADDKLATKKRGSTIGILGAPDSLTPPETLTNSGWVSCLGAEGGVSTAVGASAKSTPDGAGASVVTTGRQTFVIAGGMRYPVAAANLSAVALALGLDGRPPRPAPAVWTNLFALGPALAPAEHPWLRQARAGPAPRGDRRLRPRGRQRGQAARRYLVNTAGELEPLPDLAHALYRIGSGSTTEDLPVTPAQVTQLKVQPQRVAPLAWPTALPTLVDETPCATLTTARGNAPTVNLSTSTRSSPQSGVAKAPSTSAPGRSSAPWVPAPSPPARCWRSTRPARPTRSTARPLTCCSVSATSPRTSHRCHSPGPSCSAPARSSVSRRAQTTVAAAS